MNELLSVIVLFGGVGLGGGAAWALARGGAAWALARAGATRLRRHRDPWVGI